MLIPYYHDCMCNDGDDFIRTADDYGDFLYSEIEQQDGFIDSEMIGQVTVFWRPGLIRNDGIVRRIEQGSGNLFAVYSFILFENNNYRKYRLTPFVETAEEARKLLADVVKKLS